MKNIRFLLVGVFFGIVQVKSQVLSWFRIQEMFHLQSFYMFGVIGSAVLTGMISVQIIRRAGIRTLEGEAVQIPVKKFHWGNVIGGLLFGFGWAITGACPGPLYALIGSGYFVVLVTLLSAIAGTWCYGLLRGKLPH
jgi:uncharacterized protein